MKDVEIKELQLLERARRGLSPGAADAARVLEATRSALAAAPLSTSAESLDLPGERLSIPEPASSLATIARSAAIWPKLVAALCIASASAGVAYYAGFRAGRHQILEPEAVKPKVSAAVVQVPKPSALASPRTPAQPLPQQYKPNNPTHRVTDINVSASAPRTSKALSFSSKVTGASLQEEIRMLQRVERALRDHDPRQALVLLGELDRSVPDGKLAEERFTAFMIARCILGFGAPTTIVEQFTQRYPESVYFARLHQACSQEKSTDLPSP
jgi:hypothetical protein